MNIEFNYQVKNKKKSKPLTGTMYWGCYFLISLYWTFLSGLADYVHGRHVTLAMDIQFGIIYGVFFYAMLTMILLRYKDVPDMMFLFVIAMPISQGYITPDESLTFNLMWTMGTFICCATNIWASLSNKKDSPFVTIVPKR